MWKQTKIEAFLGGIKSEDESESIPMQKSRCSILEESSISEMLDESHPEFLLHILLDLRRGVFQDRLDHLQSLSLRFTFGRHAGDESVGPLTLGSLHMHMREGGGDGE